MQANDFKPGYPGELLPVVIDGKAIVAYVPNPLPPKIEISMTLTNLLCKSMQRLGELNGVARLLPNPGLLVTPFLNREAVLSSRIEGTVSTTKDLALAQITPTQADPDTQEVRNYVMALKHGIDTLVQLPVCNRLVKDMHGILMQGVRGQDKSPGNFRRIPNFIASRGQTVLDARFVPPPAAEMLTCMDSLEKYINSPCELPSLIRAALIHYQFETIHPFIDGNGRIGRLLIVMFLVSERLLKQPMLYLSAYFEKNRRHYTDALLGVSQSGDWDSWVSFFLRGVESQAQDAVLRSQRLMDLWTSYQHLCKQQRNASTKLFTLLDALMCIPAINIPEAGKILDMSFPGAQKNVSTLVELGILTEITGKRRDRIYVAEGIIDVIEAEFEPETLRADEGLPMITHAIEPY